MERDRKSALTTAQAVDDLNYVCSLAYFLSEPFRSIRITPVAPRDP